METESHILHEQLYSVRKMNLPKLYSIFVKIEADIGLDGMSQRFLLPGAGNTERERGKKREDG